MDEVKHEVRSRRIQRVKSEPRIPTKVVGHSLVSSFLRSHRSLIRFLCPAQVLCCTNLFARSITHSLTLELVEQWMINAGTSGCSEPQWNRDNDIPPSSIYCAIQMKLDFFFFLLTYVRRNFIDLKLTIYSDMYRVVLYYSTLSMGFYWACQLQSLNYIRIAMVQKYALA